MLINVVTLDEAVAFLRCGCCRKHFCRFGKPFPAAGNQARGWSNCAVLTSFLLGRACWTWTPHGLYRLLAAEQDARPIDFPNGSPTISVRSLPVMSIGHCKGSMPKQTSQCGPRWSISALPSMTALMSGSGPRPHKVAISEVSRFGAAAARYWQYAPERAIEAIPKVLERRAVARRGQYRRARG